MKDKNEAPRAEALAEKLEILQNCLTDQKAADPFAYVWSKDNPVADAWIIVTASSGRHARGLADHALEVCRSRHYEFLSMEGYEAAQWILIDCNDVMIHILLADTRAMYRLEDLCRMREPMEKEMIG